MLPAYLRLKKTREIERVFKEGRGFTEGRLLLKAARNGLKVSRFAFVAGQKVSKKATQRNKIKRRMREAVKASLPDITAGFDVVITALQGAPRSSYEEVRGTLQKLLKKSGLIK